MKSQTMVFNETRLDKLNHYGVPPPWAIVLFLVVFFVSVAINLRVLFIVTTLPKRRRKSASLLVGHLSAVSILITLSSLWLTSHHVRLINYHKFLPFCQVQAVVTGTLLNVYSLNVGGIVYERIRRFSSTSHGKLLTCRMVFLMWLISILANIPLAFTTISKKPDNPRKLERCVLNSDFPLFGLVVVYELMRFLLFHLLLVCYMGYAMWKISFKLKYLYILKPIPSERMKRRVQSIRFIYIHFLVFILTWFPMGLMIFLKRVLLALKVNDLSSSATSAASFQYSLFIGGFVFVYLILNPLIYICLLEKVDAFFPSCRRTSQQSKQDDERVVVTTPEKSYGVTREKKLRGGDAQWEGNQKLKHCRRKNKSEGERVEESLEMSRISTVGKSTTSTTTSRSPASCNREGCATGDEMLGSMV